MENSRTVVKNVNRSERNNQSSKQYMYVRACLYLSISLSQVLMYSVYSYKKNLVEWIFGLKFSFALHKCTHAYYFNRQI